MLSAYLISSAAMAGVSLFILLVSCASLMTAKEKAAKGSWYAREEWVPKSKYDVKIALVLLATSPLFPIWVVALVIWLAVMLVSGIRSAFQEG